MLVANFTYDDEFIDENLYEILDWFDAVFDAYYKDDYFLSLKKTQQEHAHFILKFFIESCYGYGLKKPGQWDCDIIDEVCLDVFPRKVSAEIECFESVAPVIISFIHWSDNKGLINNTANLCNHIAQLADDIVRNAGTPSNWGMAKSMMMLGPENIQKYYQNNFKNTSIQVVKSNKIGRNAICSCGSGKKYKKCCLMVTAVQ